MKKPAQRTATILAGTLGAIVLALPVSGYDDSSRYYDYSESPAYGESQSWRGWGQNRPGHEDWSEERQDRRRAWNRLQHERREMEEARREGDWSEYRHDKREAKEAARALKHHHHDD